jgi:DNA-binding transcriptional regulator YiaG
MIDRTVIHAINATLDRERRRHGLPTDNTLARHLGVSTKTLSLWRNGKSLSKAAIILIRLMVQHTA